MTTAGLGVVSAIVLTAQIACGQTTASSPVPPDSGIRTILVDRVDTYRRSVGIVVGVIEPRGRRVVAYGKLDQGDPRPLDGNTIFEIGSITKVFTSLLLADMTRRGEVALTDPVAKYLPAGVGVPDRGGRQITLEDLATHTSGLPREASNFDPNDLADWEAGYSVEKLYEFLSSWQPSHDIGSHFEYSNLGASLLGIALTRRAGMDYESLVQARIAGPLAMTSTRVTLTPEMKMRFAAGHGYALTPAPNMNLRIFAGAGALRSTVNDLLTFLAANLGYSETPLAPAMAVMLEVHRPMAPPLVRVVLAGERIHLGWLSSEQKGATIVWHNGGTLGYKSFIGFDPKARVGVVVLSNDGNEPGVDDIGMHLLNPKVPLLSAKALQPPKQRQEVAVDPKVLDTYVGRYKFPSGQGASVTRKGGHLVLKGDGDPPGEFVPETSQDFFGGVFAAELTFKTDGRGRATEMIFRMNGSTQRCKRIE